MAEKCLMVTTLAVLVFHPSSTITCFRPNSNSTSPQDKKDHSLNPIVSDSVKDKESLKSRKKLGFPLRLSLSRTCTSCSGRVRANEFTELVEGELLVRIVEAIFRSGWTCKNSPTIEKILKVNHDREVLNRFEAFRRRHKSKAQKITSSNMMERAVEDGKNELLQFHSTNVTCSLESNGMLSICNMKSCGVCRMISCSNFAKVKPVSFFETSRAAHDSITRETGVNGRLGSVTKAMVVCKVIEGHAAPYCARENKNKELEFKSIEVSTGDHFSGTEELILLNPRAILPCFVVLYSVRQLSYKV